MKSMQSSYKSFTIIRKFFSDMARYMWLGLFLVSAATADFNYCRQSTCGGKHVGCANKDLDDKLSETCESEWVPVEPADLEDYILHYHNHVRNLVAEGAYNLPKAAHMSVVVWDEELARLAKLNAHTCQLKHDKCRDTEQFRDPTQTVYSLTVRSNKEKDIPKLLTKVMDRWGGELNNITEQEINAFPSRPTVKVRHITNIINDRVSHIGCGAVYQVKTEWVSVEEAKTSSQILITCNYSASNYEDDPVYITSTETASECTNETDEIFTNLCSANDGENSYSDVEYEDQSNH